MILKDKVAPSFTDNAMFVLEQRYLQPGETPAGMLERVSWDNQEYYDMLARLDFLPNSPTLFNGGITTPDGDPIGTLSACFKFDVEDNIESIMGTGEKAARVQKWGGGVGYALTKLRPKGSPVKTTNRVASGPVGFLHYYNAVAKAWTQGGKRDGAQMGILHCDHPDIREFIHCKDNINAVESYAEQFRTTNPSLYADLTRGLLTTFNISVACTDEFMEKATREVGNADEMAESNDAYELLWEMANSAWKNGDPGCYFIDTSERTNPTPWIAPLSGTNPCGEVPLMGDEPCNLGSINLGNFVNVSHNNGYRFAEIDFERLEYTVRLATRYLDDVLDHNTFPHPDITSVAMTTRKLGLGVMGLADLFALMNCHYDSEMAVDLSRQISRCINEWSLDESIKLGKEKGICPAYFVAGAQEIYGVDPVHQELPRNATRTCIAPTGTISLLANASGGIEPHFNLSWTRFVGSQRTPIQEKIPVLEYCDGFIPHVTNEIAMEWHIRHQAAWQENVDLAVSKTINCPNDTTPAQIRDGYIMMWKLGCKGGTIYRDGSRAFQVLDHEEVVEKTIEDGFTTLENIIAEMESSPELALATRAVRRRLPDERQSITHKFRVGEQEGYITVGLYEDGQPGELFITCAKAGSATRGYLESIGILTSMNLQHGVSLDVITRKMQGITFEPNGFTGSKLIPSASSIVDYVFHWMRHRFMPETLIDVYHQNGNTPAVNETIQVENVWHEYSGALCPDCGEASLHMIGGCNTCTRCGWSSCG